MAFQGSLHRFTCIICMEYKQTSSASPAISPTCAHRSNVCMPCLQTYIETALSSKTATDSSPLPKCPECPSEISFEYVQETLPTLAPTYSDHLLQRCLRSIPDYRPCLKPSCSGGQLHSGRDEQPIVTCPVCSEKSCFTCRIPWHASRTCEEVESEDKANKELLEKLTKVCPGCGARVEKIDGCDHMTCTCRSEWCWLCRASYVVIRTMGNEGHKKTCTHWRGPTGEEPAAPVVEAERPRPARPVPVRQSEIEPARDMLLEMFRELESEKLGLSSIPQREPSLHSAPARPS
jgi:hypothetical protein